MDIYLSYIVAFLFSCTVAASNENGCPSGFHTKNTTRFGSKTGYQVDANLRDDPLAPDGCTVKSIWMLIRHGATSPSEDLILPMLTRLEEIRIKIVNSSDEGTLCSGGLNALKNWKMDPTKISSNLLTPSGMVEQIALGGRWRARLGDGWTSPFHSEDYLIRSTLADPEERSAKYFMRGFISNEDYRKLHFAYVEDDDAVLKPSTACKRFKENLQDNPETMKEREKFFHGKEMKQVLQIVRNRTGVDDLELEDVELMYEMLRYEEAWMENTVVLSPWRSMFSEEDIEVLSYLDDLKYYYRDGYWNELSAKIACETVADLMKTLNESTTKEQSPKGVFSFSDSGIIWKLFSRLGLFKPIFAPSSTNFIVKEARIWNSGVLDPFSSNFAAVLYSCPSDPDPYKVQIFVQERLVASSMCKKHMCSLEDFREFVSRNYECDLRKFCSVSGQSRTGLLSWYLILASVFFSLKLYVMT